LPLTLAQTGRVKETDLEAVSRKATQDGAILYNPRALSQEQIRQILSKSWQEE
jgi:alcohol dehydrogenase